MQFGGDIGTTPGGTGRQEAALATLCALIEAHGTLHYRLTGRPERLLVFAPPDAAGNAHTLELPVDGFWDALAAPDLAVRFGWHEAAGAGGSASAAFSYALARPGGGEVRVEDRAWRIGTGPSGRRETHGILYLAEAGPARMPDAAALALGHALSGGSFDVAYQPVVDSGSGRIGFHECLARFLGPDGRLHAAASFMPRLAAAGLATAVDRQVLARAFETLAAMPTARLSVNIHPRSVGDSAWLADFDAAAAAAPGAAERLIVEITEQGAMEDVAGTRRFIGHLREAGTALALDDFGEGQTSFAQLRDFRFDIVKIAGSFVRNAVEDADSRFFIRTLVGIARHFEMLTVAEFVQTAACARVLAGLGVDCFQGFFYGRPSLVLAPTEAPEHQIAVR